MTKWVAFTARKLKPGTYEDWRTAWEQGETPAGVKAYICRNVSDPDEIVAFGMIDATQEEIAAMRPDPESEKTRAAGMAPYVDSIGTDGFYEVIEEVEF